MKILFHKMYITLSMIVAIFFSLTTVGSHAANLVQFSDLQYLGAFRVPGNVNIDYGGKSLGYNPGSSSPGTLFISCLDQTPTRIAEVSIPTPVNSSNLNNLNTATLLQSCANPTAGGTVANVGDTIGGMMILGGKLYTSIYTFYDATASQNAWLFVKPNTNLSQANAVGAYTIDNSPHSAGFLNGWMAPIPNEWQTALHGTVASGNCCLSIIDRTSRGPAAFAWDPARLTSVGTTVSATPLLYYPSNHPTLGQWSGLPPNNTTIFWNNSGNGYRSGGVIPNGVRSILFFGSQGVGPFCYGTGGASGGNCYDPVDSDKGNHGYPYQYQIMAYDLNDLAAVASGTKQPYTVLPYAVWPLTSGLVGVDGKSNRNAGGAVYDPTLKRIYFSAPSTDHVQPYSSLPLIHVFQVNTPGGSSPTVPIAPNMIQVR